MLAHFRQVLADRGEYRLTKRLALGWWHTGIAWCQFEDNHSLHIGPLWITLWKYKDDGSRDFRSWGIEYDHEYSHFALKLGEKYRYLHMPWAYDHCITWYLTPEGNYVMSEDWRRPKEALSQVFDYTYTLKNGEVQHRKATVTVERREWCWRYWPFKKLRWPRKVRDSLNIDFDGEVGERTGSWKGGVMGTGAEFKQGDTIESAFERFQREAKFN